MKTQNKTLIALGLASMLGLAACGKTVPPGQVSDTAAAQAPKESATIGAALDDTGITAQVKTRLASDERTKASELKVETNNGIVTLSGSVKDGDAKDAAEELARNVPQVKGIDNQIVAPSAADSLAQDAGKAVDTAGTAIADTAITTKVKAALLADARTKGTDISVTTEKGKVTLSGSVASSDERKQAIEIAKKTDGVREVESSALKIASK